MWLKQHHLFPIVLEGGRSKMNVLVDLVSGKDPLPGLQMEERGIERREGRSVER